VTKPVLNSPRTPALTRLAVRCSDTVAFIVTVRASNRVLSQNNSLLGSVKVKIKARCRRSHFCPIRPVPESRCGVTWTGKAMKSVCMIALAAALSFVASIANAEMASIYGGRDGLCGSRTANGERLNCAALTAAHRKWRFGTLVRVCHNGCVTVRINDRGPWVKGRDIDLSPAAGKAIGISSTGHVTLSTL
jgi:rare lipoprotein A